MESIHCNICSLLFLDFCVWFTISLICDVTGIFETLPPHRARRVAKAPQHVKSSWRYNRWFSGSAYEGLSVVTHQQLTHCGLVTTFGYTDPVQDSHKQTQWIADKYVVWKLGNSMFLWQIKSDVNPLQFWHSLQWRHNKHDGVSNHQPPDCLLNYLFGLRSKKTSKLRFTGLCAGNSTVTGEFPAQMASNAESVSIWWCHHGHAVCDDVCLV